MQNLASFQDNFQNFLGLSYDQNWKMNQPTGISMPGKKRISEDTSDRLTDEELNRYLQDTASALLVDPLKAKLLNGMSVEYPHIFYKGNLKLLERKLVSVVGTRTPSVEGKARAIKVVRALINKKIVVVSGLAKGIDTVAHKITLSEGGLTVAVLGTPIHKVYPAENKELAQDIINQGLLISPAAPNQEQGKFLFPRRNRLMARMSSATIIIEAGPTSGVIHQAAECLRQGKKLILLKSVAENKQLPWVAGFLKSGASVVADEKELIDLLEV